MIDTTSPHSSLVRVVSWGQVWLLVSRIGQAAAATSDLVDLLTAGLAEDERHTVTDHQSEWDAHRGDRSGGETGGSQ